MRSAAPGARWRACTCASAQYPMHVMHNYVIPTRDALEFAKLVERIEADALSAIESVSSARRPLLAYGAVGARGDHPPGQSARDRDLRARRARGAAVREPVAGRSGQGSADRRGAANSTGCARARPRTPRNCSTGPAASSTRPISRRPTEERRLRRAACLLSDIAWRAHPDYRAEQSHDMIVNADLIGIDHPSRAYLALSASYRHVSSDQEIGPVSRSLVSARQLDRARILGAAMRVAYILSAAMPGVLPRAPMTAATRQGYRFVAAGPRRAQQRPTAEPAQAVRAADRRRPRSSRRDVT